MMRLTPSLLRRCLIVAGVAAVVKRLVLIYTPGSEIYRLLDLMAGPVLTILAYLAALGLSLRVAADFKGLSTMRGAWLLIAASSAAAIARVGMEWSHRMTGWMVTPEISFLGLRQIPIFLSHVLVLGALLLMWSAFTSVGLGWSLKGRDVALIFGICLLVPPVLWSRDRLSDSQSVLVLIRYLQYSSPLLTACSAVLCVVLYRTSEQMAGGRLALSLRYLAFTQLLPLSALMTQVTPGLRDSLALDLVRMFIWGATPWLFALAIAHRWELTERVTTLIGHYEACAGNPDLAVLTGESPEPPGSAAEALPRPAGAGRADGRR